jgi:UDP-N-acetylmuramoyl-L-alanyl-D-glutamate--2,6-diaminopimelate ligase
MIELGELTGGMVHLTPAERQVRISSISADSRTVGPGCVFAALPGTRLDGVQFVPSALANGAAAILVATDDNVGDVSVPVIRLDDPHLGLAKMAARMYHGQPQTMVAVTGTAGKTSVAEFTRQIWKGCGRSAASIGTTGVIAPARRDYGNLTTPDPVTLHRLLDRLSSDGITNAAMEASSHGLDQKRLHGVVLSAAAFTNLGRDHMDYHDDVEDYFQAKMRLFEELLPKGSPAVIFSDDPISDRVAAVAKSAGHQVLRVGRKGDYLSAKRVEHERYRQVAEIVHADRTCRVNFPLAGDFQVANGLVAAGLAMATGEDFESVMACLEDLKGASGRLELIGHSKSHAPVYVDYAHKPEALENVLASLRPFASHQLVVVFGCGGDRDPGKRPIMGEIAQRLADSIIVTDDNPRTEDPAKIRSAILAAAPSAIEIADRRDAIRQTIDALREGDCLVIAGKGHETGQIIGDEVLEFSDHEEVRKALGVSVS